ncbi:MAG: hypothetical protein EOM15_03390 [Spirochaetia bacterium]|nr:hypothetical protein [Spirochaetia bacterium]
MEILEQLIVSKRDRQKLCEDGLFINEHFAAVIDGCTSKNPIKGLKQSSGVIAKECLLDALSSLDGCATMEQAFLAMNDSIVRWYEKMGLKDEAQRDTSLRPSAYAAVVSAKRREVWVLGDCQALFEGVLVTKHKAIDTLMEDVRRLLIEHALLGGKTYDQLLKDPAFIQDRLDVMMRLQSAFQNTKEAYHFGYAVLDGFFFDTREVQVARLPEGPVEVVLASDGYPVLFATLEESEAYLHQVLSEDPLMVFKHGATKPLLKGNVSFDDRSFLRILV